MRKIVWYLGKKYYRIVPFLVLGYMAVILIFTAFGFSRAVMVMSMSGRVIVIDPGHGGYDPGAIAPQGLYEKDINLAIGQKLKAQLAPTGAQIILTREDDRDYVAEGVRGRRTRKQSDLDYRISIAEEAKAEIFVSIHVNATPGGNKSGAEAFFQEGSEQGRLLAEIIQEELRKVPTMNKRIAKPGEFYLTRKTKITTVIVELGYLSNLNEREKLQEGWYQEQLTKAIARGIIRFLEVSV